MKVKLQNTYDIDDDDFGLNADDLKALRQCEDNGMFVEILCTATDGYFDVELPTGEVIEALSGFHLVGLEKVRGIDFFED